MIFTDNSPSARAGETSVGDPVVLGSARYCSVLFGSVWRSQAGEQQPNTAEETAVVSFSGVPVDFTFAQQDRGRLLALLGLSGWM